MEYKLNVFTGTLDLVGGGGANVTLSNLTSPTAVNQNLIFDTGTDAIVKTKDDSSSPTNMLVLESGNATNSTTGNVSVNTGHAGNGASGDINLATGNIDTNTSSGTVNVYTGTNLASGNGASGNVNLYTGAGVGSGNSGDITSGTGNVAAATSGNVVLRTGQSSTSTGASGHLLVQTGATLDNNTGFLSLNTGSSTSGTTGNVVLETGQTVSSPTGEIYLYTGTSTSGSTGRIILETGTTAGARGRISLMDGSESGGPGLVWTSTDSSGTASWAAPATPANLTGGIAGSLPYQSATSTTGMLGIGTTGQVLTVVAGLPAWASAASGEGTYDDFYYLATNTSVYGGTHSTLSFTGSGNTLLGVSAGNNLTSGIYNTMVGNGAGQSVTSGGTNVYIGAYAGPGATASGASSNTIVGYSSGYNITTANNVTMLGYMAGNNIVTPINLTAIGSQSAGSGAMTGANNTLVGFQSGNLITSGHNDTYLGYNAGSDAASAIAANSTAIGSGALVTGDNQMVFGNTSVTQNTFQGNITASSFTGNSVQPPTLTASAGGATILTSASNTVQIITGTLAQIVELPSASTLPLGISYFISNESTGIVTVNKSGASLALTMPSGMRGIFKLLTAPGAAGTWDISSYNLINNIVTTTTTSASTFYPVLAPANSTANQALDVSSLSYVPSTGVLTATTFSGALTGAASLNVLTSAVGAANGVATLDTNSLIPVAQIPPAALERMIIVADQTARYALTTATAQNGDTVRQTDTGLMYYVIDQTNLSNSAGYLVYSAGSATVAATIPTTQVINNASYYPLIAPSSTNSNQVADLSTGFSFNPSTNTLTTTTFSGALSGNATTATTATNATNVGTTTTVSASTFYPVLAPANSTANQALDVSSLSYVPSTGNLTATTFTGALAGNASTVTTNANLSGVITSSGNTTSIGTIPSGSFATTAITGTSTYVPYFDSTGFMGTDSAFTFNDTTKNLTANSFVLGLATTATAAGTTTLVAGSKEFQQFTGTTTQTVVLPDATTLFVGQQFDITNRSTGVVTVNTNGGGLIQTMAPGSQAIVTVVTNGTTAGTWDVQYSVSGLTVSNPPTVSRATSTGTATGSGGFVSGTYTTPANVAYIKVKLVGGGGGGGSGNISSSVATSGGNTTFGSSLHTAGGGAGAQAWPDTGAGGTNTVGSGAITLSNIIGGGGSFGTGFPSGGATSGPTGGIGGTNPMGGAGIGGWISRSPSNGVSNTGAGGGAGGGSTISTSASTGGSAGGYLELIIANPAATYAYSVGTGGPGATASGGGAVGGTGGTGYAEVTEYYNNAIVPISTVASIQPTIQKFTSGSGTYTTPTGVQYIKVRMVGGGGGGGGSGTGTSGGTGNVGTASTASTFGTSLLNAGAGGGGATVSNGTGGAGGTASLGSGPVGTNLAGGVGNNPNNQNSGLTYVTGGTGAGTPFGGAGAASANTPANAITNTGSGGGGGATGGAGASAGCGGGASGFVDAIIANPLASYSYVVGVGGSGGTAGTSGNAGASGASGYIEVTEYYTNLAVGSTTSIAANQIFAGPGSGSAANPNFRSLVAADFPGVWTAYTPTITTSIGTITTSSAVARWQQFGKTVFISITATITTNGTGAGNILITLPTTAQSSVSLSAVETATSGYSCVAWVAAGGSTIRVNTYLNAYPAISGSVIFINGSYETQ